MERNELSQDSTQDALCVREKKDPNCLYMPEEPPGPSQRVPGKVCEQIVDMFDHVWTLRVEEKASVAKCYADRVHKQEEVLVDTITFLHSHKEIKRGGHPSTSQERSNQKLSIFDIQQCDNTKNIAEIRAENERVHELLESAITSLNLKLSELREESSRHLTKLEEEKLSDNNTIITAEIESLKHEKQTEIEQLRQALNDFQDMVVFRNEPDKSHADELARLQSLTVKENEENEILKIVVEDLHEQQEESRMQILIQEDLTTKKEGDIAEKIHDVLESVTASHQLELRESSETNIQNTRKLEEDRLALSETNANITAELDSVRAQKQAEIEQLRLERLDLQDNIDSLNAESEYNAKEMARLQSLILIQEELTRTNEGYIAGKQMVESVTASLQLELRESRECYYANIRKSEEENLGLSEHNEIILAELESLRQAKQTVTDALGLEVLGLQNNIGVLIEEKNSDAHELARLQSLTVKQDEENKNLKTEMEDYKDQLRDAKVLILVDQELFTLDQTEKAENQQLLETEKLALRERIAVITEEFESLREQTQAENKQLGLALLDLQKTEVLLNEKTALQDVQQQMEEAYQQIAWQRQVNEELSILTSDLKQSLLDLEEQLKLMELKNYESLLEMTHKSSIETTPEDQSDTSSIETTPEDQSDTSSIETTPTDQSDTSSIETTPEDQSDTSSIETTPEDQSDTSSIETTPEDQSDTSSIETTPTDHSIESLPESSLDEDETRSVWRYGSKGLLRFAMQVGISALVTVTGGIIAASVDAFNSDCNGSQSSHVCSLLTSFCDISYAVPPPF
nr:early endosome antigen 1-like [Pseudochaenichthys georgianus]